MTCIRKILRHILASVLVLGAVGVFTGDSAPVSAGEPAQDDKPLRLFTAPDPHYIAPGLTDHGAYFTSLTEQADGKYMLRCEDLTDAFVRDVIAARPDALLLPGDLSFNGARESHLAFADKLRAIRAAGIPVYVIPGNHDLLSGMAASFQGESFTRVESVSPGEFAEIYADFGYEDALSRDSTSLSYTADLSPAFRLLAVDVNTPEAPGALTDSTFQWVKKQLSQARRDGKQVIAMSHQTLLEHSFLSYGFVIRGADRLLKLYEKNAVLCNLSGHMHVQHIRCSENGLPDFAGSALITWPHQVGVLLLDDRSVEYSTQTIRTDFDEASRLFLWNTSRRQGLAELEAAGIGESTQDPADRDSLAEYLADCNVSYVAGRASDADWEDPRYALWQSVPSLFAYYLQTIRLDSLQSHTHFAFRF